MPGFKFIGTLKHFHMLSLDSKIQKLKPPPVSVVDVLPKGRDSKRVLNPLHNLSAVTPGRMRALHFMCACGREITADHKADIISYMSHLSESHSTCICPTKHRALRVVSQAVWQAEVIFNQNPSVGAVHVRGLDLGGVTVPVGPV